jgi:transportin-1
VPDYIAYLSYILGGLPHEEDRVRSIAGYLLKNNARLVLTAAPEVTAYTKASILQSFVDPSIMIRNAAGQAIVAVLGVLEPRNWPECLEQLFSMLDSSDLQRQEVRLLRPCYLTVLYILWRVPFNHFNVAA